MENFLVALSKEVFKEVLKGKAIFRPVLRFLGFRRIWKGIRFGDSLFFSSVRLLDGRRRQLAAGGCYLLKSSKHGGSRIQDRVTATGFLGGFPPLEIRR